jgi:hypothetical protein
VLRKNIEAMILCKIETNKALKIVDMQEKVTFDLINKLLKLKVLPEELTVKELKRKVSNIEPDIKGVRQLVLDRHNFMDDTVLPAELAQSTKDFDSLDDQKKAYNDFYKQHTLNARDIENVRDEIANNFMILKDAIKNVVSVITPCRVLEDAHLKLLEIEVHPFNVKVFGGKLQASLIGKMFEESHKKKLSDIGDYKVDRILSNEFVKVYHNPKSDWTVIVHRGSKNLSDAIVDMQLAVNFKNNARFKMSKDVQKQAEAKYNVNRMSVIGSSLGGTLAQEFGSNAHEIITSGKPTTIPDIINKNRPSSKQFDVRTHTDPISMLKPLMPHKNDIQVQSKTPFNPMKSHFGKSVMDHFEPDKLIGHGRSMRVGDLKKRIIVLRKHQKDKSSYLVTGKNKKQLVAMLNKLEN